ncbi:hypothetical protein ACTL32_08990 [Planococcus sp. FY231025]|uniref:hypothetical protein n=1 Tax=Planococcus sp. FY231025 TaxID=3455699 RepID=UPI003F8E7E04
MKKWRYAAAGLIGIGLLATGSIFADKEDHLNRVDVFTEGEPEERVIADEETLAIYRDVLADIDWETGNAKDVLDADYTAVLFNELEKNMPERLFEHRIAFAEDGTAEIESNNEEEGYGVLNAASAETLQTLFRAQN